MSRLLTSRVSLPQGCQALNGAHRTAVQKFKELPRISGEWVLDPSSGQTRWQPLPPSSPGKPGRPPRAGSRGRDEL